MKIRRSLSMLGVAATAFAGVALAADTAAASTGGGCGTASYGANACINASGNTVNYDTYITSNGLPSNCTKMVLSIRDDTSGAQDSLNLSCLAGHDAFSIRGINGHHFHSTATVWTTAGPMTPSVSPELIFNS